MSDLHLGILGYCRHAPYRTKINLWYIDIKNNFIRGNVRTWNVDYPLFSTGEILGYSSDLVIARIGAVVYALVLGAIDPEHADKKDLYFDFLESQHIRCKIII